MKVPEVVPAPHVFHAGIKMYRVWRVSLNPPRLQTNNLQSILQSMAVTASDVETFASMPRVATTKSREDAALLEEHHEQSARLPKGCHVPLHKTSHMKAGDSKGCFGLARLL